MKINLIKTIGYICLSQTMLLPLSYDSAGHIKSVVRMDGAGPHTLDSEQTKRR